MNARGPSPIDRPRLQRFALGRPEARAWALYDWANSGYIAMMTAIFPIYFASVAAKGLARDVATARYALATTIALALVAIIAPILGNIADYVAIKKRVLGVCLAVGVISTALMFFIGPGDWRLAAILMMTATVGANGSFVFYDALLPHVARGAELDRLSTAGYALGYLGGGILLAVNLTVIENPGTFGLPSGPNLSPEAASLPVRLAFVSVALWWLAFSIPLFRRIPEPPGRRATAKTREDARTLRGATLFRSAYANLRRTAGELRGYRQASLFLIAFLIYNDGIGTIVRMAVIYGTEIGISRGILTASILLVQFIGLPFSFLFGAMASRIGAKRAIYIGLTVYAGISALAFFMENARHFLILAILVGMVQGGTQALSRSLFASMIPRAKSGAFFGFFSVAEKFAGIFGPAVFATVLTITGSSRHAILSVIAFFIAGGIMLRFVDVDAGKRRVEES